MSGKNSFCYLLNCLLLCCLLILLIGCADASCSEVLIAKIREKIADTKFALSTALNTLAFGLQKYEPKNSLSAKSPVKLDGTEAEKEFFEQIISVNLALLHRLTDHLRAEENIGKKPTKISQEELIDWMEMYLKENSQKDGVEKCEYWLYKAKKEFQSEKPRGAEESTQLLLFFHFFMWEIYANVEEGIFVGEEERSLLNKNPVLNGLNQLKLHIADLINNGPLAAIKRQLLLGMSSDGGGVDFKSLLNVAIQASIFPFLMDRQKRRKISFYCRPFTYANLCFFFSSVELQRSLWKMARTVTPEALLTQIEAEMAKWLQGENLAFLLGFLNGRVRNELAVVRTLSEHWKMDNQTEGSFLVFFLFARFYRHLAEEIWRRIMHNPQTMTYADLETAESMQKFVRETLAGNEQIFQGSEEEMEQKHLSMKLMVMGPEIISIQRKLLSQNVTKMVLEDNFLEKATAALIEIRQLDENKHFCKKLAIVLTWIAAWEMRTVVENAPAKQKLMEEFEQKMAKWSEEIDKSRCLIEVSEFGHKLMKIVKPEVMNKGNANFLQQILYKGTDGNEMLDFKGFFAENEFYVKVARLLTELDRKRLLTDDFEGETLAILDEINNAEEKLLHKFITLEEERKKILEFLKKFASSIDHFESKLFHLKMVKQFSDEWGKEQRNCLNVFLEFLANILVLEKRVPHLNFGGLQAELGQMAKQLAMLKGAIQGAFLSKISAAKYFLDLAVRFWETFENFASETDEISAADTDEEFAKIYNEFARRLEQMGIDGVQRDMFGRFNVEKMVGKVKNSKRLDGKVLELAVQLLRAYEHFGAKQIAVVKIRGQGHMNISVGLIEYDFTMDGPRRRKYRENLAESTSVFSPDYSIPMAQWGMVEVGKADKVFYEMVQSGWHNGNYGNEDRDCRTFVYFFICRLFNGKCPPQESWPKNFVDLDSIYTPSVFSISAQQWPVANAKNFKSAPELGQNSDQCELKGHRFEFQIEIKMSKKRKEPEGANSQQEHMSRKLGKMLPPIVQYQTGKFVDFDNKRKVRLEEVLTLVQVDAKEMGDNPEKTFEATLMAYACKSAITNRMHAYVREFGLRDRTNSVDFKMEGFPKEFDLLEGRRLPIIRITGFDDKKEGETV